MRNIKRCTDEMQTFKWLLEVHQDEFSMTPREVLQLVFEEGIKAQIAESIQNGRDLPEVF